MAFVRIYTGDDGQTHFEDLDLPGDRAIHSGMQVTPGVNFRRFEPGYFSDWHTAPRRQYVITLAGEMEVGIGDGTKRRFGAGDVLLADDLTRPGSHHRRGRRPAPRLRNHSPDPLVPLVARRRIANPSFPRTRESRTSDGPVSLRRRVGLDDFFSRCKGVRAGYSGRNDRQRDARLPVFGQPFFSGHRIRRQRRPVNQPFRHQALRLGHVALPPRSAHHFHFIGKNRLPTSAGGSEGTVPRRWRPPAASRRRRPRAQPLPPASPLPRRRIDPGPLRSNGDVLRRRPSVFRRAPR